MKKVLLLLLALAVCCTVLAFVGCNNQDDTNDNNGNTNANDLVSLSELPQYMANINEATALGISPKKQTVSRLQEQEKNYLVMTTEEYDSTQPSIDENGLLKVTFSKIVTENVTTDISGVKFTTAKNSKITFSSIDSFTYSIFLGEECLYESVYDNDDYDMNDRQGYITLDNMIDGNRYEIRYTGIGKEEKITQDEIDGEIDKMYVMDKYTFISFVPIGMSYRWSDIDSQYDRQGYLSDNQRQSFVIDNVSGYIYLIENMAIEQIGEGLLKINGKVYDVSISDNDELQFLPVVKNETLNVYNFFKDKYGNKYIQNDYLDICDKANKTVYYTKSNYILTKEGIAIHIEYSGDFNYSHTPDSFSAIEKVNDDLTCSTIDKTEMYQISYKPINGNSLHGESNVIISHIENGFLYLYSAYNGGFVDYWRVNINAEMADLYSFGHCIVSWGENCVRCSPVDYNTVIIWSDYSGIGKVYYGKVWELFDNKGNTDYDYEFVENKLNVLLENCVWASDNWDDMNFDKVVFRQTTLEGTIYYKIVMSEQGIPQIVNTETYIAPNQENITILPLNK